MEIQTEDFREVRGFVKREPQQEEPNEMKAVIKRLSSQRYRGISQLLPSTGLITHRG